MSRDRHGLRVNVSPDLSLANRRLKDGGRVESVLPQLADFDGNSLKRVAVFPRSGLERLAAIEAQHHQRVVGQHADAAVVIHERPAAVARQVKEIVAEDWRLEGDPAGDPLR